MANNTAILQTLEQTLQQVHPSLLQKLNAGLSTGEIDKIASDCQVSFTGEIYDLFTWRNGIPHDGSVSSAQLLLFPDGIPLSLSEVADKFNLLSLTKHLFEPNYFPLFSGNEDVLLIDIDQDSPTYKTISLYAPSLLGSSDPMTIYDSFPGMIETVIACYDQKAFWIDQDSLQVDSDAHYTIAGNLNPGSQYWQVM